MRNAAGSEGTLQEQPIGFLSHRDSRVAYAATGGGPLLLLDLGPAHHLDAFWRHAGYRSLVQRLARRFTVVRWDRPGFGLSDRHTVDLSPAGDLALVERIVEVLAGDAVAIVAAGGAAPGMVRFAARHPGRVSRLALFGAAAAGHQRSSELNGAAVRALADVAAPAIHQVVAAALATGSDPEEGPWLASALEASASVATMVELSAQMAAVDVTGDAVRVQAPTLVLHRTGDAVVEPGWGRALAGLIPGAEFVAVGGTSHLPYSGDTEAVIAALLPFLTGDRDAEPAPLSRRELEVAHLVTLGLTNAEIGRRLAIGRRTVDAHLEHIRSKLGVTSRARIAAWAVLGRLAGAVSGDA